MKRNLYRDALAFLSTPKKFLGVTVVVAGILAMSALASPANAATGGAPCTVPFTHPAVIEQGHDEYQYFQTVPGAHHDATTHKEWQYQVRIELHGSREDKTVTGYDFVPGGITLINGHLIPGHWEVSPGDHLIPAAVINAVWGPSGVPPQYLGTGQVSLSQYGGPNVVVNYSAVKVITADGFTDWSAWSDWSTTDPGPATKTLNVAINPAVSDNNAYDDPSTTIYYVEGGAPSTVATDASWVLSDPDGAAGPWALYATRHVIDVPAKAAWTENVATDCVIPIPVIPDSAAPTCDTGASLTLVDGEHYKFAVHTFGPGSSLIVATPDTGNVFAPDPNVSPDGKNYSLKLELADKTGGCAQTLAFTGVNPAAPAFVGGSLLLIGDVIFLWRRLLRRRMIVGTPRHMAKG